GVVAVAAELRLAAGRLDRAGVGPDADVAPGDVYGLARPRGADAAAAVAVGAVDPAVQPPHQPVDAVLLVALAEAGEQHLAAAGDFGPRSMSWSNSLNDRRTPSPGRGAVPSFCQTSCREWTKKPVLAPSRLMGGSETPGSPRLPARTRRDQPFSLPANRCRE